MSKKIKIKKGCWSSIFLILILLLSLVQKALDSVTYYATLQLKMYFSTDKFGCVVWILIFWIRLYFSSIFLLLLTELFVSNIWMLSLTLLSCIFNFFHTSWCFWCSIYMFSVCPTIGGSNPGLRAELIHSVKEKLSLICGCAFTTYPSAFASVSVSCFWLNITF